MIKNGRLLLIRLVSQTEYVEAGEIFQTNFVKHHSDRDGTFVLKDICYSLIDIFRKICYILL